MSAKLPALPLSMRRSRRNTAILTLLVLGGLYLVAPLARRPVVDEVVSSTTSPVNLQRYHVVMDAPEACPDNALEVTWLKTVFLVTSHASNHAARVANRATYSREELQELGIARVFVIGLPADISDNARLEVEAGTSGDLLQFSVNDTVTLLGHKTLLGLQWVAQRCAQARFIFKLDDDVLYDAYQIADLLAALPASYDDMIAGTVDKSHLLVSRARHSPYYVGYDEYNASHYPDYVLGLSYMLSPRVATRLIAASMVLPPMWKSDVYITGVLAEHAGIQRTSISRTMTTSRQMQCCRNDNQQETYMCGRMMALVYARDGQQGEHMELLKRVKKHAAFCHVTKACKAMDISHVTACIS